MPRQLQLTQNLLDRAATVWNVIYGTVSFLINFPSHFEAFVKWIDSLDPSQALASSKIGAYLLARHEEAEVRAGEALRLPGRGAERVRARAAGSAPVARAARPAAEPARAGELSRRVAPPRRTGSRGIIWDYPS